MVAEVILFLKNDASFLKKYNDVFAEQKELGITEPATETAIPGNYHYIPYHPVTRERKSATRLKTVFDTSAKSEVPSLDECLHKLSQLTRRVFDILVRFRTFRSITLTYDIEKAFL